MGSTVDGVRRIAIDLTPYARLDENGNLPPATLPGVVRLLDLGVVSAVDLLANGPRTLYTPGVGEYVWGLMLRDLVPIDTGTTVVSILTALEIDNGAVPTTPPFLAMFDGAGDATVGDGRFQVLAGTTPIVGRSAAPVIELTNQPIVAYLTVDDNTQGFLDRGSSGAWQGEHTYAGGDFIVENDSDNSDAPTSWTASAGETGAIKPSFARGDSPITDGGVTWTVNDAVPTTGAAHVFIQSSTPVDVT